jgi:hypothetical protein
VEGWGGVVAGQDSGDVAPDLGLGPVRPNDPGHQVFSEKGSLPHTELFSQASTTT